MIIILYLLSAFAMFAMVRNHVVYRAYSRRLDEILAFICSPAWLDANLLGWTHDSDDFHSRDYYTDVLFHPHVWTYAQFFPRSVEECAFGRTHV